MRRSRLPVYLLLGGAFLALLYLLTHRDPSPPARSEALVASPARLENPPPFPVSETSDSAPYHDDNLTASAATVAELARRLSTALTRPSTRAHEAVLLFRGSDGYRAFLARAAQSGVIIVGQIDQLNMVRVRVRAYDDFAAELVARAADYGGVSANTFIQIPPPPEERVAVRQVAVGDQLLATLGVPTNTDTSAWGRGVTIAVLDGGATPDPTLGPRLRYRDIGLGYAGTGVAGVHGTAVAALAAGSAPDARGVAPAAEILSIRVLDTDDKSDVFTVAQGVVEAVDAGARIVNLSLGGYSTSDALSRAIDYATDRGVVLVAAAGNDGASRLVWPAADPRVLSVGATDATGRQASFSNAGSQLQLTAPGVALQTAGVANERILFSGTSASAPVVSGALAVILSQSPGTTPAQAAEILRAYSDDAGAAGPDADYGSGVLNLGWVLARNDPARRDTAVSGHHYNPETASLEVVLQNRGALAASNLALTVELNGKPTAYQIPLLEPRQSLAVAIPIDAATAAGPISFRTRLDNPEGTPDVVPANNTRASLIDLAGR